MNTYSIGRRTGKTICFSNPEVSNDHAEIVENNGSYLLMRVCQKSILKKNYI
jgi:pSer/pThr/pTyr-binding forkhead associated (FHA) protein